MVGGGWVGWAVGAHTHTHTNTSRALWGLVIGGWGWGWGWGWLGRRGLIGIRDTFRVLAHTTRLRVV